MNASNILKFHLRALCTVLLCCLFQETSAQLHLSDAPKKAVKAFEKGRQAIKENDLEAAEKLFSQAVEISPTFVDPYLYLGDLNTQKQNWKEAVAAYEEALKLDPTWKIGTYYRLARALAPLEEFEAAAKAMEVYLSSDKVRGEGRIKAERFRADMLFAADAKENALPFTPVNLGPNINTPELEYLPSLSADEQTLVYTIRLDGKNEDFYISERGENGKWKQAINMGAPVNTPYNEGAEHLSADGRMLFFTACNLPEGMGSCDIYFTVKKGGRWTRPQNAGPGINGKSWDTQPCLSADGSRLYFISNRSGGQGDMDIWVSDRLPNGSWGEATNLGPALNTAGKEQSPFIHPDGATLYFSSDGHPGLGGTDLYLSKTGLNGKWEVPLNLGYPINTISNEGSLVVSTDGNTGYFASDRFDGLGGLDLYSFEMPEAIRPFPVTYVKARVTDPQGKPLKASTFWKVLDDKGETALHLSETNELGEFFICLPSGANYAIRTEKEGYLFNSQHFSLDSGQQYTPYELDIVLQPIEQGGEVVLRNVFFDTDSEELLPTSLDELERLHLLLKETGSSVIINGHTDDQGEPAYNQQLSEKRANSVKAYLISKGIAAEKITAVGYGETKPLVPNDSPENRAQNRRTTFELR